MKWRKLGLIYSPNEANWWQKNGYAFLPTADYHDGVLRVYFASLDEHRFGRIGCVELDAGRIDRISHVSAEPVLDIGELGAFDDCGVNPSCLVRAGDRACLYYIGWQRCERVPYMLFSGLAVRTGQSGAFERRARTPVLDRTEEESFSRSAPCVLIEDGAFRVWYWSCSHWTTDLHGVRYNTVIRHARSPDGIRWQSCGAVCLAPEGADYALGRPWVLKDAAVYKMWFSIRSRVTYRLGYAESSDGLSWTRKDSEAGISPSDRGWDSEMICHPCVVDVVGQRLIFYNGNRHGREGFGCAVLDHA